MANTTTITLKLTSIQEEKLFASFQSDASTPPAYAKWQLRPENCVITCYTSGKTVFQGKDASIFASAFTPLVQSTVPSIPVSSFSLPQAGSDEVGTGDYFGPVVVCAAIVTAKTIDSIKALGVRDSKALTDKDIRIIGPKLRQILPHSLLILDNKKYNRVHVSNNINSIKAKLHNQAYINLEKKYGLPDLCVIDQFTPKRSYYNYLQGEPKVIGHIHFETKAEDKYPAVGAASVIARYAFLTLWDEMEKKYGMTLQKGAGSKTDLCAREFVDKFGMDELAKVVKLHFRNTEKLQ